MYNYNVNSCGGYIKAIASLVREKASNILRAFNLLSVF